MHSVGCPAINIIQPFIMSINHGHVCSKSFLTRSHLWLFNYKQKKNLPAKEDSRLEVDLYVCVLSTFSNRLKAPPPSLWTHHKHPVQAPTCANRLVLVIHICHLCQLQGTCAGFQDQWHRSNLFSTGRYAPSILQTLFHLSSGEKKKGPVNYLTN